MNEQSSPIFTTDDLDLAEELGRRAALAIDNARLFRQRSHIARTLQRSFLPSLLPHVPGLEIAARYRPAGEGVEVGGDFYDAFEAGDGRWAAVMGDVCGKGAEAAALTSLTRHTIRSIARQGKSPVEVLRLLNEAILGELGTERFCTVAYVELRVGGTPHLRVVCAGHPIPLVVRADGSIEEVGAPGTLLGWFDAPELALVENKLEPGDALVLFTDGVVEERNDGELFGEERLRAVLSASVGRSAEAMAGAVEQAVRDFRPDFPKDDLALLVIRRPAD